MTGRPDTGVVRAAAARRIRPARARHRAGPAPWSAPLRSALGQRKVTDGLGVQSRQQPSRLRPRHGTRLGRHDARPGASGSATAHRRFLARGSVEIQQPDRAATRRRRLSASGSAPGRCNLVTTSPSTRDGGAGWRGQRRGAGTRAATLIRFHALMVTAIAITCPSSRSENRRCGTRVHVVGDVAVVQFGASPRSAPARPAPAR